MKRNQAIFTDPFEEPKIDVAEGSEVKTTEENSPEARKARFRELFAEYKDILVEALPEILGAVQGMRGESSFVPLTSEEQQAQRAYQEAAQTVNYKRSLLAEYLIRRAATGTHVTPEIIKAGIQMINEAEVVMNQELPFPEAPVNQGAGSIGVPAFFHP